MEKIITILTIILLFTVSANAALVDNDDGTITDTDTNLMWLQDANYAKTSGYDSDGRLLQRQAHVWFNSLDYAGYDDWRAPSAYNSDGSGPCNSYYCPDSEMGYLYFISLGNTPYPEDGWENKNYSPFINVDYHTYWTSNSWTFDFQTGHQGTCNSCSAVWAHAWAVRVIPEPISSILFIIGGAILTGRRFLKLAKKY